MTVRLRKIAEKIVMTSMLLGIVGTAHSYITRGTVLGKDLQSAAKETRQERRERERERERSAIVPYMGFGWGYPYYASPYYGWGWPYGGYGYSSFARATADRGGWGGGHGGRR